MSAVKWVGHLRCGVRKSDSILARRDSPLHLAVGREDLAAVLREVLEELLRLLVAEDLEEGGSVHRRRAEKRIGHARLAFEAGVQQIHQIRSAGAGPGGPRRPPW